MSGRVPVFIHFNGASSAPLGRRGLLRPFEEWQGRGKELLGALRLRHVTAALDQRDLRLWQGRVHVGQMAQREHEVLAAPDDERRTRVERRARDPRVAQRATYAANPHAGGQRAHELGERAAPVALRFRVQLGRDTSRVVKARAQTFTYGAAGSGQQPRDEAESRQRARTEEERDVAPQSTRRHEDERAGPRRRGHRGHVRDSATHRVARDVRSLDSEDTHRGDDEARVERFVGPEVAYAPRPLALPEARQIERNDLTPGRGKSAHDRPPVLGPATDTVNEQDRLANRAGSVLHEDAGTKTLDRDRARLHLWLSCSQCSSTTSARSARSYTEKRIPRAPSRRTPMSTSG